MAKLKKLAIFDFDGTIYTDQSPDMYVDYVASKNLYTAILEKVCSYLIKKPKYNGIIHKKVKLLKARGVTKEDFGKYAVPFLEEKVFPSLIDPVYERLLGYIKNDEFEVLIASASYEDYIKPFCDKLGIKLFVATKLKWKNGKATGEMDGYDCIGYEKVKRINKIIDTTQYDLQNSVCYSDSWSDKPIFNLVGIKYFVKNTKKDCQIVQIPNDVFAVI